MDLTHPFKFCREHLQIELKDLQQTKIFASYYPLFRRICLYEVKFPNYDPVKKYTLTEIEQAIPKQSFGYYWHELIHHMQLIGTAQGVRSLAVVANHILTIQAVGNFLQKQGNKHKIPWRDTVLSLEEQDSELLHIHEQIAQDDFRNDTLVGKYRPPDVFAPPEKNPDGKSRVHRQLLLNKEDATGQELYASVTLKDGSWGRVPLDILALREGMANYAEHAVWVNGIAYNNPNIRKIYLNNIHSEMLDDDLLTYYVLFMWFALNVPQHHANWSTFLALCEMASMFDSAINTWPSPGTDNNKTAPSLWPCGYFVVLLTQLYKSGNNIDPVNEDDPSPFVESLLSSAGLPDLSSQSDRALAYMDVFKQRNEGNLFNVVVPYSQINEVFKYRRDELRNRLLLFELMGSDHDRGLRALVKLGIPSIQFSNAAFSHGALNTTEGQQGVAILDVLSKIYTRRAFHCRFWEELKPQICKVYREKGCVGNPFPGTHSTKYQDCAYGRALVMIFGDFMRARRWLCTPPDFNHT